MDLKKYKYIKNVRPKYNIGKSGFSPTDPTRSSLLSGAIGPKTPDLSNLTSALNPTNTVSNIANTAIPSSLQQSTLSNVGLGTKLKAGFNVANKAVGSVLSKAAPIMSGINAIKSIGSAFSTKDLKSANQISDETGYSEGSINGISYQKTNAVNGDQLMKEVESQNGANTIGAASAGFSAGNSIAGPIGGVVGGLIGGIAGIFGGKKRKEIMKRRIQLAKERNLRINAANKAGANTQALERDWYEENENNTGDILYANKGKDMNKVWTPTGYRNGHINSMVGKGESIINFNRGTGTLITKGQKGVDNQPSSVKPGDSNVILGNDVDWANGMKFSDQAAPYTAMLQTMNDYTKTPEKYSKMSSLSKQTQDVQERELNRHKQPIMDALASISARQQKQHQIENKVASGAFYDNGKIGEIVVTDKRRPFNWFIPNTVMDIDNSPINYTPKYVPSTIKVSQNESSPNVNSTASSKSKSKYSSDSTNEIIPTWIRILPSAYGMLQSINQYNRYKNEGIERTNSYRSNPYAREALRGLASLRYDMYPELQAIRDAERRSAYGIVTQGGLTAGQRAAARVANSIATQRNLAQTYANASNQNNQYKQQYYTALMNAGQADRQARMTALQQDYENYARAHGAKYKGMDVATANKIDQLNNWFANEFKYRTYKDTADIYRQQLSQSEKDLVNNYTGSKATVNNPVVMTTPVSFQTSVLPDYSQNLVDQYNSFMNPYYVPAWGNPLDFSFKNLKKYATV